MRGAWQWQTRTPRPKVNKYIIIFDKYHIISSLVLIPICKLTDMPNEQ